MPDFDFTKHNSSMGSTAWEVPIHLLLKKMTQKFSIGQVLLAFNVVLIVGVGGTLGLMRAVNDVYLPIPASFLNIALIGLASFAAVTMFVVLILYLRHLKRLENVGAMLVVLSFVELLFFVFVIHEVFAYPLRSHINEDRRKIIEMVAMINKDRAAMRKGSFSLENAYVKGPLLVFQYRGAGNEDNNIDVMRKNLTKETCEYFTTYSQRTILAAVSYIFYLGETHNILSFKPQDCDAHPLTDSGAAANGSLPEPK
jgi:hypothetical protein